MENSSEKYPSKMNTDFFTETDTSRGPGDLSLFDPDKQYSHGYTCKGGECHGECQDSSSCESDAGPAIARFSADDLTILSVSPKTPPSLVIIPQNLGLIYDGKQNMTMMVSSMYNIISLFLTEKIKSFVGYCEPLCTNLGVYSRMYKNLINHKFIKKFKAGVRCKGDNSKSLANVNITKTRRKLSKERHDPFILFNAGDCDGCSKSLVSDTIKNGRRLKGCKIPLDTTGVEIDLNKLKITEGNYDQFKNLKNYIFYCDISNPDTLSYFNDDNVNKLFDTEKFMIWVTMMAVNNLVFVNRKIDSNWSRACWVKPKDMLYIC